MTAPTFRPIDAGAYDDDTALSAEHGRRLVRDTLAGLNQRPMHAANPFQRYAGDGTELQTLWRWCINWGYIGPFTVFSPRAGTVRLLLGLRTNGGSGAVRLYAGTARDFPGEAEMNADTNGGTVGEQAYYRLTTSSADVALVVPVVPGRNVIWLAIRCEEDTTRTRETFTGPNLARSFSGRPSINVEPVDDDPIGMFAEVSVDSFEHSVGSFSQFTVPDLTSPSEFVEVPVVFEPSLDEWVTRFVSPNAVGYVEIGWTTALYIDSVSIDGTGSLTLEDRAFGPAFRYDQFLSAAFAGQAVQEAMTAHTARLPIVAFGDGLIGSNATAAQNNSFRILRRAALASPTGSPNVFETVCTVSLGAAAATPAIDWQEVMPGRSHRFDVYTSVLVVLTTPGITPPAEIEYRARIVDAAGTALATGDVVTLVQNTINRASTPAGVQGFWSGSSTAGVGTTYGLEGMSGRGDIGVFIPITLSVEPTGNLDVAAVQRLEIQVRAVDPALSAFLIITPPCVQMADL
jgi:hypothetical protein